jgi:hypothetical protein
VIDKGSRWQLLRILPHSAPVFLWRFLYRILPRKKELFSSGKRGGTHKKIWKEEVKQVGIG